MTETDPAEQERPRGDEAPTGFPEPPGEDSGDHSQNRDPHHALNNPIDDPDPTEWPDPYEQREDPRDGPGPAAPSTSEPHPLQDPEAIGAEPPERDNLDD